MSTPFRQPRSLPRLAAWPERIIRLASVRRSSSDPIEKDAALSELWAIVNSALARYAREHARSCDGLSDEDVSEIVSSKALHLFRRLEDGSWDPAGAHPGQVCAFLSTLAHHGLVDRLRTRPPRVFVSMTEDASAHAIRLTRAGEESPEVAAARAQFTRALCACLSRLTARSRRVWLFRACLEMSGREIARHPDVRMTVAGVGVALARCRQRLSACLRDKGYGSRDVPRGSFTALWEAVSGDVAGRESK